MAENLEIGQASPGVADAGTIVQPQEKLLKQSEVNELVGRVKSEAYQRGLKEGALSPPSITAPSQVQFTNPQMMQSPQPQASNLTADDVNRMLQQHQANIAAQQIAQQFNGKLEAGRAKYNDFDTTLKSLQENINPNDYANLVLKANGVDNAADVMYNIAKNPEKLAKIVPLTYISPYHAGIAINELSQSLKQNENAAKQKQAREPLGQIEPSNLGVDSGDEHNMSVSDFRKIFR